MVLVKFSYFEVRALTHKQQATCNSWHVYNSNFWVFFFKALKSNLPDVFNEMNEKPILNPLILKQFYWCTLTNMCSFFFSDTIRLEVWNMKYLLGILKFLTTIHSKWSKLRGLKARQTPGVKIYPILGALTR